ncbi:MAG: hypothetical protein M3R58_16705 [Pseudomonadota bacterium]|nr:hypothetical protein [Pseudomonadota bacterium]
MKSGLKDIIGKQIAAVVYANGGRHYPTTQVFLVFTDGTRFEFYGPDFSCCAGLDQADRIAQYVESNGGEVVRVYGNAAALEPARASLAGQGGEPCHASAPAESLEGLLTRDLNAWIEAKDAIARAKAAR